MASGVGAVKFGTTWCRNQSVSPFQQPVPIFFVIFFDETSLCLIVIIYSELICTHVMAPFQFFLDSEKSSFVFKI